MHEASLWKENCFVTLTYERDRLPPDSSLFHRDFQLFMKRLRKRFGGRKIRFYMCGEYGELNQRPHFHACLFNVDFRADRVAQGKSASGELFFDSALLREIWGFGRVSVQDLTNETASYCARYVMKKVTGDAAEAHYSEVTPDGEVIRRRPEYAAMSLKPGIGAGWLDRYRRDVFPHDFVVSRGARRTTPRYYTRLAERIDPQAMEHVKFLRGERAKAYREDQTPERLAVREEVHLARVSKLKRSYNAD